MDKAELREVHVKALIEAYWRLFSYAVHDGDCTRNKPPRFRNCSCGLEAVIEAGERAADLLDVAEESPTEYERKVAQMKEDFPNGI